MNEKNDKISELQLEWLRLKTMRESAIVETKRPFDELLEHLEAKKANVDKDFAAIKSENRQAHGRDNN